MKNTFLLFLTLGGVNYVLQKLNVKLPTIINNYLNDFLIIPIVLIVIVSLMRIIRKDELYKLSWVMVVYLCGLYSFLFEFYFPSFLERYTYDPIDIVMYCLGGIFFYLIQNFIRC